MSELWMCWKGLHVQAKEQMVRHHPLKNYPREVTDKIKVCRECGGKVFVRAGNVGAKGRTSGAYNAKHAPSWPSSERSERP